MIQKQINGRTKYLYLIIAISLLISSCSSVNKFCKFNYINGDEFYNDSLKISGRFFGDIEFYPIRKKNIKKKIRGIKKLKYKDLLLYGRSNVSPLYDIMLFYKNSNKKYKISDSLKANIIIKDTINNKVLIQKSFEGKKIFLYLHSLNTKAKNVSLILDAIQIINSMRPDKSILNELTYMKIFNMYKDESNILFVLNKFENAPILKSKQNEWVKFQLLATILSNDTELEKYKELINNFESKRKNKLSKLIKESIEKEPNSLDNSVRNVLNRIEKISKNERILMLNEFHWLSKDRVLAYKLLKPLKDAGYNYLALEALYKGRDSLLNKRGFPIKSTGYYTREPYFGLFVRKALKLGFKIVSYDDFDSKNRELTQAENIKKIFDKDSTAKVFVYAGVDHIMEYNDKGKMKRMAEYFKENSGINPLTISQIELIGNTKDSLNLFKSSQFKNIKSIKTNVDYFIINNLKTSLDEIFKDKRFNNFSFHDECLKKCDNKNVIISIYLKKEYTKYKSRSIPILNRIILVKNKTINVKLPIGKYHLTIRDENNQTLNSSDIVVN